MTAPGTKNISAQIFSAMPTPAKAITPKLFKIARITIKETPVSASCAATVASAAPAAPIFSVPTSAKSPAISPLAILPIFALSARSFSFPAASYIAKSVPLAHIGFGLAVFMFSGSIMSISYFISAASFANIFLVIFPEYLSLR